MAFETIRKSTAPEMVVEQILKKLQTGELKPGSQLPSQRELAQFLGVGRSSVREATNALAVMGYLEVLQGKGTFIRSDLPSTDVSTAQLKADQQFLEADLEFHYALAEATGNAVICEMMKLVIEKVLAHHGRLRTKLLSARFREYSTETAKKVIVHVGDGNAAKASELMRNHLNAINSELKDIVKE